MNPDFWQARSPAPDSKVTEKLVNELQVGHFFLIFVAILEFCGFFIQRLLKLHENQIAKLLSKRPTSANFV